MYFDPSKSTSGQRFFHELCRTLANEAVPLEDGPVAVLFNVSVPVSVIFKAKLRGQRIALRVDGLYFDRLSPAFLATFRWPLRMLFGLGLRYPGLHDVLAFWANFISRNYAAFARVVLADVVIYQSMFSRQVYSRYFQNKAYHVILNGSVFKGDRSSASRVPDRNDIRLITIYDGWRPAKRIDTLVDFVVWAKEVKQLPIQLTILGYTGAVPACAPPGLKARIESSSCIRTLPKFDAFDSDIEAALLDSDVFITFCYRDSCPNTVVESMAHGLPVVAVESGGVPEICGNAGVLIPFDDFAEGWFCSHRYDCRFPPLDFEHVLEAVLTVIDKRAMYQQRVSERFATDLGIEAVATRYATVLRSMVHDASVGDAGTEACS